MKFRASTGFIAAVDAAGSQICLISERILGDLFIIALFPDDAPSRVVASGNAVVVFALALTGSLRRPRVKNYATRRFLATTFGSPWTVRRCTHDRQKLSGYPWR